MNKKWTKTWQVTRRNFIEKETLAQVLSCEFCEFCEHLFLQNTSGGCSVINGMLWRSNTGDLLFHLRYPIKCVKFIRFSLRPPRLGLLLMQFCFSHIRHVYSPSFWYIESWIPVKNVWEAVPRKCSLKNVLLKYL